jgi:hypothetical protein
MFILVVLHYRNILEMNMKFLMWLVGIILSLVILVYVVVFTPFGNSLVAPFIEAKIKEQTKLDSRLETFLLSMKDFEILLYLNDNNTLHLKGNYSLLSQTFDAKYKVALENLKTLKPLTNQPLQGDFHTDGEAKGDMKFIEVNGVSDVAKSNTSYHVELTEFNPTSIIAKVKRLKLQQLLYMLNQTQYASSDVDLNINFKNITPHAMDGDIRLKTKNGKLNTRVMKKDFDVIIPPTAFSMKLDAKLKGDDIDYRYNLLSNLAKITSSGKVLPKPLKLNIKYGLDIKELAVLKPITNVDVKGDLKASGTLKGIENNLINKISMKGSLDNKHLTKVYEFKSLMPKFDYALNMQNLIKKRDIDTALKFRSTLADLDVKKATLKLADSSLVSDYVLKVPSLDKLYFVTERHLRGGITLNGEVKKAKDLDFSAHSNVAGGKLDAKLHNDDFHADISSMQTLDILHMLIYPEIFKSDLNAKVDYNLALSKGKMDGNLVDGKFMQNNAFSLVKQYAKVDMYIERFKGDVSADIDKENILASLSLKSNKSSIVTKNTYLNSKTKKIKSKIDIDANHNPVTIKLSGNAESPNIGIDATDLIKKEATKAIKKEIDKNLGKEIDKHLGKGAQNIIKGFF